MSHRYAFSTKGVLRHLNWNLIREYCLSNGLFLELDCLQQDEPDVESVATSIQELVAERRVEVEQDFQDLYELADDDGARLIYEEARARGEDLTGVLTELDGAYDAAMWTLLNRASLFADLVRFHSADTLNKRYWRRRFIGSGFQADTSPRAIKRLSSSLTTYLVREEGRGLHCFVECLERSTGVLFVAYPEDFGTTVFEYDGDELVRRKIRPATDLLFFFSPALGTLEVFCQGARSKVRDLEQLFGLAILGAALPEVVGSATVYDLNLLKDDSFSFSTDPYSGLQSIEVKWVHVRDRDGGRGITVEVGGPPGRGVLRAAERYWSVARGEQTDKYPFHLMDVEKAKLRAHFRPIGRSRRGRTKTFTVSLYGCLLDHEGMDGIIRRALSDSGLERSIHEPVGV